MAAFSETSTWEATVSGVDDGDVVNAAETNNAPKQLANRTTYLRSRSVGAAASVDVPILLGASVVNQSSRWTRTSSPWNQIDTTDAGRVVVPVTMPRFGVLESVSFIVEGASGHASLPATMPIVQLYVYNISTGVTTNIVNITDTTSTIAGYEAIHLLTDSSMSRTATEEDSWWVELFGETGSGALAGLKVHGLKVQIDTEP